MVAAGGERCKSVNSMKAVWIIVVQLAGVSRYTKVLYVYGQWGTSVLLSNSMILGVWMLEVLLKRLH